MSLAEETSPHQPQRERYLTALLDVQQILLATKDGNPFPQILKILGEVSGVSRIYIYDMQRQGAGESSFMAPHLWAEWCAPDIPSRRSEDSAAFSLDGLDVIQQGEPFIQSLSEATHPAPLERLAIKTVLYLPIHVGGNFWGILGCDRCLAEQPWQTEDLRFLQSAATAILLWNERESTGMRLRQSEGRLRTIVENAAIGIVTSSPDGRLLDTNLAYQNFVGYSAAELKTMCYADVTHPDEVAQNVAMNQELLNGKRDSFQIEKRYVRKDGRIVWGRANVSAVRDRHGQLQYCLCVVENISQRKLAEAALQEREILFRLVFENSAVGIGLINPDGTVIAYNPASRRLLGYSEEEMRSLTFHDYTHPDDLALDLEQYRELLAGQIDSYQMEKRYIRKDKQIIWIRLTASAIRDQDGNTIVTSGLTEDITDQKRAEAALQERTRLAMLTADVGIALTEGNTLQEMLGRSAEALFHHLDVAFARIWIFNDQTRMLELEASAGLYRHLDGTHSRIPLGQYKIGRIAETRQPHLTNHVLQDPQVHDKEWAQREGMVAFAGYPLIVEDQLVGVMAVFARHPLPEASLEAMGAIANEVALGIQRKRGEEALRSALEAAEVANRAKSQFLSHMSHELRTPLNVILGFTQLLLRGSVLSPQQQTYLDTINRSGEHLLALINDVLEMSKIEAGQLTLNPTNFDLHQLLDWLYPMLSLKARAKHLHLQFEREEEVPRYLRGDRSKLLQILMNLLSNAIKFTSEGQVILRIRAQSVMGLTDVVNLHFEVEDTGVGISTGDLPNLFEPFIQTQVGQESQEGTGLGLAISQRFARLLGGEITVQSQVGQGSVFQFNVTMQAIAPTAVHSQSLSQRVIGLAPGQPNYCILVVEDKGNNRQFLVDLLSSAGFAVQEAIDGEEAIAQWQTWHPQLIWMDIRMPGMDGYEATRRIREAEAAQGQEWPTTIIALTGSAFEEERRVAIANGCDDFVRKPVTPAIIFEKLTQYLGVHYTYAPSTDDSESTAHALNFLTPPPHPGAPVPLTTMPADWIHQLHQAALQVNRKKVLALIQEIPPEHRDLAQQLTYLIEQFRFEEILKLTN